MNQEGFFRGILDQGKGPMYRTIYSEVLLYQVDKESFGAILCPRHGLTGVNNHIKKKDLEQSNLPDLW